MPQTGMDWWEIVGVIAGIGALVFAWLQWRGRAAARTRNHIGKGNHNQQSGGAGVTENTIDRGDHNQQRGA